MTEVLGFIVLAAVVVLYLWAEWCASAKDRQRRDAMVDELRAKR